MGNCRSVPGAPVRFPKIGIPIAEKKSQTENSTVTPLTILSHKSRFRFPKRQNKHIHLLLLLFYFLATSIINHESIAEQYFPSLFNFSRSSPAPQGIQRTVVLEFSHRTRANHASQQFWLGPASWHPHVILRLGWLILPSSLRFDRRLCYQCETDPVAAFFRRRR